jgi:hypothetical protein
MKFKSRPVYFFHTKPTCRSAAEIPQVPSPPNVEEGKGEGLDLEYSFFIPRVFVGEQRRFRLRGEAAV